MSYIADEYNPQLIAKFARLGVEPVFQKRAEGPLTGVKFVITGTLEMGSREEVAAKLEALGAKEQKTVTKDTTYLIVGEAPGGSKVKNAAKLGIKQFDELSLRLLGLS